MSEDPPPITIRGQAAHRMPATGHKGEVGTGEIVDFGWDWLGRCSCSSSIGARPQHDVPFVTIRRQDQGASSLFERLLDNAHAACPGRRCVWWDHAARRRCFALGGARIRVDPGAPTTARRAPGFFDRILTVWRGPGELPNVVCGWICQRSEVVSVHSWRSTAGGT